MNKLAYKKIFLSLALPSGILSIFMYAYSTNIDYSKNTIQEITNFKTSHPSQVSTLLLASEYKEVNKEKYDSKSYKVNSSELEILNEKLSIDHHQLAQHISTIEKEHKEIIQRMRKQGQRISKIEMMSPRLKVVISTFLDVIPSRLNIQDLEVSSLSSTDWYYLNLLADSNDFKILLKNNELTHEFLQLQNLKRLYGKGNSTVSL